MTKKILPLLATAATLVAASGASAANQSTPPASSADLQLKGAYAYIENFPHVKQPYIAVVFRTTGKLERRFDGLVRAGASLGDSGGGSVGGVAGKKGNAANHCYTTYLKTKDGRIYGGAKINVGSRHTLTVSARGVDGTEISDSTKLTIKKRKLGDRSGKPLGC